ncbi:sugar transferase [Parabacteroides distasonis]|uniref:sugar transferase n=1 Tax=Parabacteroides distasonis TaxID=823 RepID=UPI00216AE7E9|nr:sugar transferase [Parabacteroides distasonis]
MTRVGKFLRVHHLDELPQLWNVFVGDMSFIGPRPERKFYIDQIMERDPRYRYLYQIRPGVTSYATLYNGYTDTGGADPRMTRVGKFLRVHHLDELPQLWNVFVGDMSFIGPRPERQFYIDQIMERDPRYRYLYQIRPGVTSYATLYNGYTDTVDKMLRRLRYDLFYLEHRSWLFDFKILVKTFLNIAFGKKF